jgi:hypothetical protein
MLFKRLAVAGLSLAVTATPAVAQDRGWMEFGALYSFATFDNQYPFSNESGIGGRVGVFLHRMFELEGEGMYMGLERSGQEFRVNDDQANYVPLYVRGTAHWTLTDGGLALTTGVGVTRTSYRYTYNWGPSASVGVRIPVMPFAAIRADVVADYLPTPEATNVNLRAGFSLYRRAHQDVIVERVPVVDDTELTRLRSDRARLDSIAAAYNRLRDSLATAPRCVCDAPAPAPEPIKTEKDRRPVTTPAPIPTQKDRRP